MGYHRRKIGGKWAENRRNFAQNRRFVLPEKSIFYLYKSWYIYFQCDSFTRKWSTFAIEGSHFERNSNLFSLSVACTKECCQIPLKLFKKFYYQKENLESSSTDKHTRAHTQHTTHTHTHNHTRSHTLTHPHKHENLNDYMQSLRLLSILD